MREHGVSGYNGGCRCETCRAAWREYQHDYWQKYQRKRYVGPPAERSHCRWQDWEVRYLVTHYGKEPLQATAEVLGRSQIAVKTMHDKLNREALQ